MKSTLLLLSFLCLNFLSIASDPVDREVRISIFPGQFYYNDYNLHIEFPKAKYSIGGYIGYRPSTATSAVIYARRDNYVRKNFENPLYNAFTIGINSKQYLDENRDYYIDFILFYRHWWFDYKEIHVKSLFNEFRGIRSEEQNVYGLKITIGGTQKINKNGRFVPILDFFAGIGIRHKVANFTVHQTDESYDLFSGLYFRRDRYVTPTAHMGMNIGLIVKRKQVVN